MADVAPRFAQILKWSLAWRLVFALLLRSTFVPDEYYQSVEAAYQLVFREGISTWEWEPANQIRSYLYTAPYMALFALLKFVGGGM
jgi:phosphatidylinositol glycan class B